MTSGFSSTYIVSNVRRRSAHNLIRHRQRQRQPFSSPSHRTQRPLLRNRVVGSRTCIASHPCQHTPLLQTSQHTSRELKSERPKRSRQTAADDAGSLPAGICDIPSRKGKARVHHHTTPFPFTSSAGFALSPKIDGQGKASSLAAFCFLPFRFVLRLGSRKSGTISRGDFFTILLVSSVSCDEMRHVDGPLSSSRHGRIGILDHYRDDKYQILMMMMMMMGSEGDDALNVRIRR